jgi:ATP synthase F1 delta subunit
MQGIAEVYSRSLFEVAQESGDLDRIHSELGEFADELASNRELQVFLFSPYFSSQEKQEGLERLIDDAEENLLRFLGLLAERHRMPVLFRIRREFDALWAQENQLLSVSVTSAVQLDSDLLKGIGERVEAQTGQQVELSSTVDADVLGGLVLRVGNMVLDASIRNRLEQLKKQVVRA